MTTSLSVSSFVMVFLFCTHTVRTPKNQPLAMNCSLSFFPHSQEVLMQEVVLKFAELSERLKAVAEDAEKNVELLRQILERDNR